MKFIKCCVLVIIFLFTDLIALADDRVRISEVAWMGTLFSANDEWIELKNTTEIDLVLDGWSLKALDGTPSINLTGMILANGYFLLERTHDQCLSSQADLLYTGALSNSGEVLILSNAEDMEVDRTPEGAWPAGDNTTKASMQRSDYLINGSLTEAWSTALYYSDNIIDSSGNYIFGSPYTDYTASLTVSNEEDDQSSNNQTDFENDNSHDISENPADDQSGNDQSVDVTEDDESEDIEDLDNQEVIIDDDFSDSSDENDNEDDHQNIDIIVDDQPVNTDDLTEDDNVDNTEDEIDHEDSENELEDGENGLDNGFDNSDSIEFVECNAESPVQIWEFLPNPDGDDTQNEWIEIKNTSAVAVDLGGWKLADNTGAIVEYFFSQATLIDPGQYLTVWRVDHGDGLLFSEIALNNSDESLTLRAPDGRCHKVGFTGTAPSGQAYASGHDSSYEWTKTPTFGADNIINKPLVASNSSSTYTPIIKNSIQSEEDDYIKLVATSAVRDSLTIDQGRFLIKEVSFNNSTADYLLLQFTCSNCSKAVDLGGVRIASDDSDFEIPTGISVKSNVLLKFVYSGENTYFYEKIADDEWVFYLEKSGLTATDETLYVLDSREQVFDAVCWANQDDKWSAGERLDVYNLIQVGAWYDDHNLSSIDNLNESVCFDSTLIKRNISLMRKDVRDTDTKADFQVYDPSLESDDLQPQNPNLVFDELQNEIFPVDQMSHFDSKDSDHDGIPDYFEILHGSDPANRDSKKSMIYQAYIQNLRASFRAVKQIDDQEITFSGFTEPNTKVLGLLNAGIYRFEVFANRQGYWSVIIDTDMQSGFYSTRFLTITSNNVRVLQDQIISFELNNRLIKDQLTDMRIVSVLPNPQGKDAGNEKIVLQNIANQSGWLNGWKIRTNNKEKAIQPLFFNAGEIKEISEVPTLLNSNGQVEILNPGGETIDQVEWSTAKEDVYWGHEGPLDILNPLLLLSKESTTQEDEESLEANDQDVDDLQIYSQEEIEKYSGVVFDYHYPFLTLETIEGEILDFSFENKENYTPPQLSIGQQVDLEVQDNMIIAHNAKSIHHQAVNLTTNNARIFILTIGITIALLIGYYLVKRSE